MHFYYINICRGHYDRVVHYGGCTVVKEMDGVFMKVVLYVFPIFLFQSYCPRWLCGVSILCYVFVSYGYYSEKAACVCVHGCVGVWP